MGQAHLPHRVRHPHRLQPVERARPSGLDGTETAGARARIAKDHKRRRPRLPALTDVRAMRLLAHRMQPPLAHDLLEADIVLTARKPHLQPRGLPFPYDARPTPPSLISRRQQKTPSPAVI